MFRHSSFVVVPLLLASVSFAEPAPTTAIPEVIITATRSENTTANIPALVKTLSSRQMEERQVRTFQKRCARRPV
ncbi:MAG: hypothetical protein R3F13_10650 [Prosthecobacter sp.]